MTSPAVDQTPTDGPYRSARILGEGCGLNAQEMNLLLKQEGFLEGEPGAYGVTEKGKPFADQQHHRGSPRYDSSWETTTWSPSIKAELDITSERKQQVREEVRASRRRNALKTEQSVSDEMDYDDSGDQGDDDLTRALQLLAGIAVAAGVCYGFYKVAPYAKKLWEGKARPPLKKLNPWSTDDTSNRDEVAGSGETPPREK